ncbi:carboxymuconolactone decarboxylase family protein [Kitasatospora sp. Root107]|uniref:carboxymuconolactone decarboxylase family protein n=1 Tax=Kitasatospora sp. Root107 TaxID=1736424 RepID=UPI000709C9B9|nr:carboxymuconolactone decarboxylase family protein [Kitasatospora sp. Root107]KQV12676.1 4-carboxymuconolactone decarboxylase [Kitasatospora sp. Root107]
MAEEKSVAPATLQDFAPKLAELTDEVLFGDVWERPGLSSRDRSLVTVSVLVALYRTEQLGFHLRRAIENGLTVEELVEAVTHLAFYAGWPNAMTAINQLRAVAEQGQPAP